MCLEYSCLFIPLPTPLRPPLISSSQIHPLLFFFVNPMNSLSSSTVANMERSIGISMNHGQHTMGLTPEEN